MQDVFASFKISQKKNNSCTFTKISCCGPFIFDSLHAVRIEVHILTLSNHSLDSKLFSFCQLKQF